MQFGFTVPARYQLLQGRHVAVHRLLARIEPGVLPHTPVGVAVAVRDLGILVGPAVHHRAVRARLEVVHEEEKDVYRRPCRLFLVQQPAHVSRQPNIVLTGDDAIGPGAQVQSEGN